VFAKSFMNWSLMPTSRTLRGRSGRSADCETDRRGQKQHANQHSPKAAAGCAERPSYCGLMEFDLALLILHSYHRVIEINQIRSCIFCNFMRISSAEWVVVTYGN